MFHLQSIEIIHVVRIYPDIYRTVLNLLSWLRQPILMQIVIGKDHKSYHKEKHFDNIL